MHRRLLPEKGKENSEVYLKMEMLVTKFSKGKYRNEGELFNEPTYLLRDKLVCGYCGKPVSSYAGTTQKGTIMRYYRCYTARLKKKSMYQSIHSERNA